MAQKKITKLYSYFSLILPITLGLGVIAWLFLREYRPGYFKCIQITFQFILGIIAGFLFIMGRDLAVITRYRILSDNKLPWRRCFYVNTLCEFMSSVIPSILGGNSLIAILLNKEGMKGGKSLNIMFLCIFFDELVLVTFIPIVLLFFPAHRLFGPQTAVTGSLKIIFFLMYLFLIAYTSLFYLALFRCPRQMERFFLWLSRRKMLHRWHDSIENFANDILTSANEIRGKSFMYWVKIYFITTGAWLSRYLVVNALIIGFGRGGNQLLALARQLVLWIIQTVSPTPGGSGISEYVFQVYYSDFFVNPGQVLLATFIWRIITFYLYLVLGVLVIGKKIQRK